MNDVAFTYADPTAPLLKRGLVRLVEATTGQRQLKSIYFKQRRDRLPGETFLDGAVRHLALDIRFDADALAAVPRKGPLVVVANHPYGVLDGIVIAWLVEKVRRDFLVLTNAVLLQAPELQSVLLPVDFSATPEALATNLASRATARAHLDKGGCVVVFPAGGISTAPDRFGRQPAVDAPWQAFTAQLIQRSAATVLPVCFAGQNSRLFQIASHVSQTLRVALIFREVRRRIGTSVAVTVGAPIPYGDLPSIKDRQRLADHLREHTYGLLGGVPTRNRRAGGLRPAEAVARIKKRLEDRSRAVGGWGNTRQPRPR